MRRLLGGVVSVLLVCTLTACSPSVRGISGVQLAADGAAVAVFGVCDGFGDLSTVALLIALPEGGVGDEVLGLERAGEKFEEPVVPVDLSDPGPAWKVTRGSPPATLDPAVSYELRAWDESGDNRVNSFPFRPSELTAGSILSKKFQADDYVVQQRTAEEFAAAVDGRCDPS